MTVLAVVASLWGSYHAHRATVYSGACDGQSNIMADGTTIQPDGSLRHHGVRVDDHVLASSTLPLGARIRFTHKVFGSRFWTVRDTGGAFDLYRPNCAFGRWGNPTLTYQEAS